MPFSNKIVLGTAQLGLNYGINNSLGKPSLSQSHEILDCALALGITSLDTADLYGDSQEVISSFSRRENFNIFSKFILEKNESLESVTNETLKRLKCNSISGYSFHRFTQIENASAEMMCALTKKGFVKQWGASLYTPGELASLDNSCLSLIQSPFNLLDNSTRWIDSFKIAKRRNISITTRSSFLQGLFFKSPQDITGKIIPLAPAIESLQELAEDLNLSITQLSLGYVLNQSEIDGVVIGVDSKNQLEDIFIKLDNLSWKPEYSDLVEKIKVKSPELLHPGSWT